MQGPLDLNQSDLRCSILRYSCCRLVFPIEGMAEGNLCLRSCQPSPSDFRAGFWLIWLILLGDAPGFDLRRFDFGGCGVVKRGVCPMFIGVVEGFGCYVGAILRW